MTKKAYDFLEEGAATYRERNAVYGDNYLRVGAVMAALFPDGVTLKTADDHNRFHIFMLKVVKLSRYCVNWDKGGHEDSLLDDMVYGGILLEIDDGIRNRPQHIDPRDPEFRPTLRMTEDELARLYALAGANGGHPVGTIVHRIEDTFDPPRYVGQDITGE